MKYNSYQSTVHFTMCIAKIKDMMHAFIYNEIYICIPIGNKCLKEIDPHLCEQ